MGKCFGVNKSRLRIAILFGMVMWLGSLAAQPDTLWTKAYGGPEIDVGFSVQQTQDLGYIIAGVTKSFGAGEGDVYLVKTDANGDTLWTRTYGGPRGDWGSSVQQTHDLGYIIAGSTFSFGPGLWDVYLIKTDANGDTLWTRRYGGFGGDWGFSVQQTQDLGYIIAGSTLPFGAGLWDVYLIKTDANGDTLWTRRYGGTGWEAGFSVQQTQDLGYIIAGVTKSFGAGEGDVYLIKTDANGDTLWTRTYGGTGSDGGFSVHQTQDLGYIIAGETVSFGTGGADVYLVKTAPDVGGIEEEDEGLAIGDLRLEAYPNPFTRKTVIRIRPSGSSQQPARVKIYDSAGRLIKTLESAPSIEWDGTDDNGKRLGSGVYFVRVSTGSFTAMEKLIMLR